MKRTRRNHAREVKAKVDLAAIKGDKTGIGFMPAGFGGLQQQVNYRTGMRSGRHARCFNYLVLILKNQTQIMSMNIALKIHSGMHLVRACWSNSDRR